jgi:hypothetical protein
MMAHTTIAGLLHLAAMLGGLWLLHATTGRLAVRPMLPACLAAALMASMLFWLSDPPVLMQDFVDAYYAAGVAVHDGPAALAPMIEMGVEGFVNLPIVAYLFWPFGWLGTAWAMALFTILGLVATWWCWHLLVRLAGLDSRGAALLLFLFAANGPLVYGLKEGNTSHLILLLLVLALTWVRSGRDIRAGVLLGVAAVIKPPLLLLGALFVLRGRWRVVAGGTLALVGAATLSLLVFGWDMHVLWYESCIKRFSDRPVPAFNVQSLQALVLRLQTGTGGLHDWNPVAFSGHHGMWSTLLVMATCIGTVGALLRPWRATPGQEDRRLMLEFQALLVLACVISPVSWSHYYTWLLLPFAFLVAGENGYFQGRMLRLAAWAGVIMASAPVVSTRWAPGWSIMPYFLVTTSGLLLAGLLWLFLIGTARTRSASR